MDSIAVFCGSSTGNDSSVVKTAFKLGEILASQQIQLVYGGAKVGLMGQVADGALGKNGKVIGVIPDFLKCKEVFHPQITELIVVETMHQRKVKMHELSDGFIALPGGYGTLEELFEIITWGQLGLHQKPIGILNCNNFFDSMLQFLDTMVTQGFLKQENREMLLVHTTAEGLLEQMRNYTPVMTPKWIEKEQT
ncbi:TIGR00730 family Rossman fold protein [Flagellimonas algicola]|uniref:Cytokinin riboside 5'-monophosphate phosphoribohydrolase n=1 Tax=Flagellimonas algicola TaxID=2583815 RepID=A0ABY2WP99_9FLAO|nr:TIGR00730 family Rossman fold protein [Allomuricauda algicola]TMU56822.1 TIGR00730 family Rossman fold protein [Allomuricauda algicola]